MGSEANGSKCVSCHGEGVQGGPNGPQKCPDCDGLGLLPSGTVLTERRLRALEEAYGLAAPADAGGGVRNEAARDVSWLVGEVRRAQHALIQILSASQDLADGDPISGKIRFLANEVLDVYSREEV